VSIELQKIDCNCNDCLFLERSLSKRQQHVDFHFNMQISAFNTKRIRLLERGEFWLRKGEKDKAKALFNEARKMQFTFDEGSCSLHYGLCKKYNKQVSFIANTCQLETKECFIHRNDKYHILPETLILDLRI